MSSARPDQSRPSKTARDAAYNVVQTLQNAGFVAYWAGGCVRDMKLGRVPKDYDVATSATPDDVCALFRRTRKVGAQFGVILVRQFKHDIEVATFRTDHDYADGRRPTGVTFSSPAEDARRRDFTINGMFMDPVTNTIHDFVGGQADLSAGIIRAIGIAQERFEEDHLRVLRAIKFSARFGFEIDPATWEAMRAAAPKLQRISPERIRMELESMLVNAGRARAMQSLADGNALDYLWPDAEQLRTQWAARSAALRNLPDTYESFELALAALLHVNPKQDVMRICNDLRCSNHSTQRVAWLVQHLHAFDDPAKLTLADLKLLMSRRGFDELVEFCGALHRAQGAGGATINTIRSRVAAIPEDEIAPGPLVTGNDLIQLGLKPGPAFKAALEEVYYRQLQGELTDKASALSAARAILSRHS